MTDEDDNFWRTVEAISERFAGNLDAAEAKKALRAIGCDKTVAADMLEVMKGEP
jgi:hypothetical protein